jgi:hypothetical protein
MTEQERFWVKVDKKGHLRPDVAPYLTREKLV